MKLQIFEEATVTGLTISKTVAKQIGVAPASTLHKANAGDRLDFISLCGSHVTGTAIKPHPIGRSL